MNHQSNRPEEQNSSGLPVGIYIKKRSVYLNSQTHDRRIGRLDWIDLAIVVLVWGSVIAYSGILGGFNGPIFRYSCFAMAALVGILKTSGSKSNIPIEMIVLLIFIVIAYASVFISIEKNYTFARATNFIMLWFFLLGVYSSMERKSPIRIVTTLTLSFLAVILVNFLVLLANMPFAWREQRFQGIVGHPNTMAAICMATYPLLMLMRNSKGEMKPYLFTVAFFATFLIHIFTYSRASLAFSLLGLGLYFSLLNKKKLFLIGITLWVVCAVLLVNFMFSTKVPSFLRTFESYVVRGESSESITTFTGRTIIWEVSLQKILERPLLGYGYDIEGEVLYSPDRHGIRGTYEGWLDKQDSVAPLSLHNGYLSVFVGTGIIGFIFWLYLLYRPFPLLWKLPNNANFANFRKCLLTMMIMGLCMNLLEYTINGGRGFFAIAFWILWTVLVKVSRTFYLQPSPITKV